MRNYQRRAFSSRRVTLPVLKTLTKLESLHARTFSINQTNRKIEESASVEVKARARAEVEVKVTIARVQVE